MKKWNACLALLFAFCLSVIGAAQLPIVRNPITTNTPAGMTNVILAITPGGTATNVINLAPGGGIAIGTNSTTLNTIYLDTNAVIARGFITNTQDGVTLGNLTHTIKATDSAILSIPSGNVQVHLNDEIGGDAANVSVTKQVFSTDGFVGPHYGDGWALSNLTTRAASNPSATDNTVLSKSGTNLTLATVGSLGAITNNHSEAVTLANMLTAASISPATNARSSSR